VVLKKEFIDTLKILFYCLLLFLIIPIARLLDWQVIHSQWEFSGTWQPLFIAFIIIFAAYSGVSIFQSEKKERAFEYLFSLPVSKWKIIGVKIVPRFLLLMLLIIAGSVFSVFQNIAIDGISMMILFLTAVFVSLAVDSLINALLGVVVLNITLYYASLILSYLTMKYGLFGSNTPIFWVSQLLPAILLLIPLAAAFAVTVKNFDMKPLKWQAKPYLTIALPTVLILLIFIIVFFKGYLTWIKKI
jgi:ABC-type Na+ efflux pump permease subunit